MNNKKNSEKALGCIALLFPVYYVAINFSLYHIFGRSYFTNNLLLFITSPINMREDFSSNFSSLLPKMFVANLIIPYISIIIGYIYSYRRNKIRETVPLIDHLPRIGGAFLLSVITSYIVSCIVYFHIHIASSGTSIIGFTLAMYFGFIIIFSLIYTITHLKNNSGYWMNFFTFIFMLTITDVLFFYYNIIPGYFFASIHWAGLMVFVPLVCISYIYFLVSKRAVSKTI